MKGKRNAAVYIILIAILQICFGLPACLAQPAGGEIYYFGIEINDVLCGYAEIQLSEDTYEGREVIKLDETVFAMMTALGSEFNTRQSITYMIDPETGNFLHHTNEVEQGETHMGVTYVVRDNAAYMTALDEDEEKRIDLPAGTHLTNTIRFNYLTEAFADPDRKTLNCKLLQVRDGEVQDYSYTRLDDEELDLVGKQWDALVVAEHNKTTGLNMTLWIDKASGYLLQVDILNRKVYRTDPSVVKSIKVGDLDNSILVKTNKSIADVQGITSMKVKGRLQPVGLILTVNGLSGTGQSFTGTVEDNAIDGVFEIAHTRYTGDNAPHFPTTYGADNALQKYLEPSTFCESDDPSLAEKALELTKGCSSSWDAATKISAWVAKNISYAIPGGGSAKKTFETGAGECGAHSLLLAAMCRSVGIPTRVVWGCMYTPNLGGSFGQHAWNEIYMGDAGWIPVDATAHEVDFVDSGHIRVGEMESTVIALNADDFEIIDYKLGDGQVNAAAAERLTPYLGVYSSEAVGNKKFTILEENGKLAMNIEGKMTLVFNDADDEGRWQCQLAPKLHITFAMDDENIAETMTLLEENRMVRKDGVTENLEGVPEEFQPMIGTYVMRELKADFKVAYEDGSLTLREPKGAMFALQYMEEKKLWKTGDGSRIIVFDRSDDGIVSAIRATHVTTIAKQ